MALTTPTMPRQGTATRRRHISTNAIAFVLFLLVCEGVGLVGALFVETGSASWYARLDKPGFSPPSWMFAPVWTALYALMALGAWRVWRRLGPEPDRSRALVIFGAQLLLVALWAPVFFGAESPTLGMLVIAALWLAVLAMLVTFAPVDPLAAVLNVPYFGWVTFAAVLNAGILLLQ